MEGCTNSLLVALCKLIPRLHKWLDPRSWPYAQCDCTSWRRGWNRCPALQAVKQFCIVQARKGSEHGSKFRVFQSLVPVLGREIKKLLLRDELVGWTCWTFVPWFHRTVSTSNARLKRRMLKARTFFWKLQKQPHRSTTASGIYGVLPKVTASIGAVYTSIKSCILNQCNTDALRVRLHYYINSVKHSMAASWVQGLGYNHTPAWP